MSTYKGAAVKIVRPAQKGDPGFDPKKDQVVITNMDGSNQQTVLHKDVTA